jgi:cyclophilin family peptidyl-prolyl cis-trans isomerase
MKTERPVHFDRPSSIIHRKHISALLIICLLPFISCGRRQLNADEIRQNQYFAEILKCESGRTLGEDGFFKENLRTNPDLEVRKSCALALGRIGDRRALPWLYDALHNDESAVRAVSAFAIGMIENHALLYEQGLTIDPRTIPELLRLLEDPSSTVQMRAIEALGKTGSQSETSRLARMRRLPIKGSLEESAYIDFLNAALARLKDPARNLQRISASKDALEMPNPSQPFTEAVCTALVSNRYNPAMAIIETTQGDIEIELFREEAPVTTAKFISLAKYGAFKNLRFTQTIPFSSVGIEEPGIQTEYGATRCEINMHPFEKGSIGMAVSSRDVETNRFFIALEPQPERDGKETCFGRVISGMSAAEKIGPKDYIKKVQIKEYIGFFRTLRY